MKLINILNILIKKLKEINAPDTFINCIQDVKIDLKILRRKLLNER